MYQFEPEEPSSFSLWGNSKDEDIQALQELDWEPNQLELDSLQDRPFDLFGSISTNYVSENYMNASTVSSNSTQDDLQQDDDEMEQSIWTAPASVPDKFNTLSWDTFNSQFPTRQQAKLADKNIGTPFLTEVSACVFDPLIDTPSNGKVIQEAHLVKSLIQALIGLPSVYFDWNGNQFVKRLDPVRILGVSQIAIEPTINGILRMGTRLKRLENVAHSCQVNPVRYGLTGVAFGCCLNKLLLYILQSVVDMFEDGATTILKLYQYTLSLSMIVEKLCLLCCVDQMKQETRTANDHVRQFGFYIPFGVEILNLIHDEIRQFDLAGAGNSAYYRDICLAFLSYSSVPYLDMLNKWLGLVSSDYGDQDPYCEFFIYYAHNDSSDLFEKFQIRGDTRLPYFIDQEFAFYILRTGISLHLLKKTDPNHPICNLTESLPLRCILKSEESENFFIKVKDLCLYYQTCNDGNELTHIPRAPLQTHHTTTTALSLNNDTLMTDIMSTTPSLPLLPPSSNTLNEFVTTLNDITKDNSQSLPTIDTVTLQSFINPLRAWCPAINESFMSLFLHQFKLESHLLLLHRYFLFGDGVFVTGLEDAFFSEDMIGLNNGSFWPPKRIDLNIALKYLMTEGEEEQGRNQDRDLVTFFIKETKESSPWRKPNAVEALDFLQLSYHASHPLDMVITPDAIDKYNRIFTFLLQVMRASAVVKRMYKFLNNTKWTRPSTQRALFRYRYGFSQFISALQGYADAIVRNTWTGFMQQVQDMHTTTATGTVINNASKDYLSVIMEPHTFRAYHEHILDRILFQCFLKKSQKRIFDVLYPILRDIIICGTILDDYKIREDMEAEDKLWVKCRRIYEQFEMQCKIFVRVLNMLEKDGSGRLGNILNSTRSDIFSELYAKHEAKEGLDVFVKDLLTRLSLNGFYNNE